MQCCKATSLAKYLGIAYWTGAICPLLLDPFHNALIMEMMHARKCAHAVTICQCFKTDCAHLRSRTILPLAFTVALRMGWCRFLSSLSILVGWEGIQQGLWDYSFTSLLIFVQSDQHFIVRFIEVSIDEHQTKICHICGVGKPQETCTTPQTPC